jgi:sodium/potassium-transporting ATPase subunit alpha
VLLVVLLLQAVFNAWQDFSTSRIVNSIKDMLPSDVMVLRDGQEVELAAVALVPGDLVNIRLGQKIPADLRLLEVSSDLKFDRAVLTGEVSLRNPRASTGADGRTERACERQG